MPRPCTLCTRPASLFCDGCQNCPTPALDQKMITAYCSTACQIQHYECHKPDCKDARIRGALIEISQALYKASYEYRSSTYEFPIHRIKEEKSGQVVVDCLKRRCRSRKARNYPKGSYYRLPEPNWSSLEEASRVSILMYSGCEDVAALMTTTVQEMLKSLNCSIPANLCSVIPKSMASIRVDGQLCQPTVCHKVLRVRMRAGDYILDLTGRQFGFQEILVPTPIYLLTRVEEQYKEVPVQEGRSEFVTFQRSQGPGLATINEMIHESIDVRMAKFHSLWPLRAQVIAHDDRREFRSYLDTWLKCFLLELKETVATFDQLPRKHFRDPTLDWGFEEVYSNIDWQADMARAKSIVALKAHTMVQPGSTPAEGLADALHALCISPSTIRPGISDRARQRRRKLQEDRQWKVSPDEEWWL